jgi:predicted nucleic acid-binding protein
MTNIFVDTNVLLDVLMHREEHLEESAIIWEQAERGKINGYISAISFNNIHYLFQRRLGKAKAKKALIALRNTFSIVPLDEKIINQSIDVDWNDFEDAIQFFSALHCDAAYIVTRNIKDFKSSSIPVLTPKDFLALF